MLLQHILTKDIFLSIFREDQFHRENNVAKELEALEETFFTGDVRRQAIERLRSYYGAIGNAANDIADYAEKQQFLKAIYEDFYKAYDKKAADRMGVVYTPNEVVDFIIPRNGPPAPEALRPLPLRTTTSRFLTRPQAQAPLSPTSSTHLPLDRLEYKYLNEIHANELAILPYYIANLNIEYTYKERTGKLSGVSPTSASWILWTIRTGCSQEPPAARSSDKAPSTSAAFLRRQLGSHPVSKTRNPSASSWATRPTTRISRIENDNNKNREYPEIDRRIKEHLHQSQAPPEKTKQYDMYKRFMSAGPAIRLD